MGQWGGQTAKNYGYGKSMNYAGKQALAEHYGNGHFQSQHDQSSRWSRFVAYAKENEIREAHGITAELVTSYAESLTERGLAVSTVQNAVSTVNTVMSTMKEGNWHKLSPSAIAGERSQVRTEAPSSLDRSLFGSAKEALEAAGLDRAAAVYELARETGMRFEEATKANLTRLSQELTKKGAFNVQEGTKGGRTADRWIDSTDKTRSALETALRASPDGSKNLLSPDESYKDFKNSQGEAREILHSYGISGFHDARAAYACQRYTEVTGHPAPCVTGYREANRADDRHAREVVSYELGHGRIDVARSYVGSSQ